MIETLEMEASRTNCNIEFCVRYLKYVSGVASMQNFLPSYYGPWGATIPLLLPLLTWIDGKKWLRSGQSSPLLQIQQEEVEWVVFQGNKILPGDDHMMITAFSSVFWSGWRMDIKEAHQIIWLEEGCCLAMDQCIQMLWGHRGRGKQALAGKEWLSTLLSLKFAWIPNTNFCSSFAVWLV